MKNTNLKGNVNLTSLGSAIIMFIVLAVVATVGLDVLTDLQADYSVGTTEYDAIGNATEGISNITERFGIIGTVLAFGMLIAIVIGYLAIRGR